MNPAKYVGRAPIQVEKFLANVVNPVLEANKEELGMTRRDYGIRFSVSERRMHGMLMRD